jgi:hypothetical protein
MKMPLVMKMSKTRLVLVLCRDLLLSRIYCLYHWTFLNKPSVTTPLSRYKRMGTRQIIYQFYLHLHEFTTALRSPKKRVLFTIN